MKETLTLSANWTVIAHKVENLKVIHDIDRYSRTSVIRTSIIRISRLSGLFLWSQFGYDYLLVTIKIRSHILFKTTALKGEVKCKGFLLSKSRGSARACRKVGLN